MPASILASVLVATLLTASPGAAAASAAQDADPEAAIRTLEARVEEAMAAGDSAALREIWAEDFRYTHGTGETDDRESLLRTVAGLRGTFTHRSVDTGSVELHGDVAISVGEIEVHAGSGEEASRYRVRYLRVWERRDGRWRMLSHRTLGQAPLGTG